MAGCAVAMLVACGDDVREPREGAAPAPGASADPVEEQRRIAAIGLPPAGQLRFSETTNSETTNGETPDSDSAPELVRRSPRSGVVYLLGAPLARHIGYAYAVSPAEIASGMSLDWQRPYDAVICPADGSVGTARDMLRRHLESKFGFEAGTGRRQVETMVLRRLPRFVSLPTSTAETSSFEVEDGELRAVGVPMSRLVEFLRNSANRPIVDETGLEERYDFLIQWDTRSGAYAFLQAVNDLGLEIVRQPRSVEVLELRPASVLAEVEGGGAPGDGASEDLDAR